MTDMKVLDKIVRPVLADLLGKEKHDIWVSDKLREYLEIIKLEDFKGIARRLNHHIQELGLHCSIDATELEGPRMTVSDLVSLIRRKSATLGVSASVVA
ncbi:MAG: hypothetical protein Q7S10_00815 [bacterium]|nr:hypothetical protein [bacterium]